MSYGGRVEKFNDGKHIHQVITRTDCKQHSANYGEPCWNVYLDSQDIKAPAICGSRIESAGFVGKISQTSTQIRMAASISNHK